MKYSLSISITLRTGNVVRVVTKIWTKGYGTFDNVRPNSYNNNYFASMLKRNIHSTNIFLNTSFVSGVVLSPGVWKVNETDKNSSPEAYILVREIANKPNKHVKYTIVYKKISAKIKEKGYKVLGGSYYFRYGASERPSWDKFWVKTWRE